MEKQAYQAWEIETETCFDDDGYEHDGESYALITKIWVPESQRGNGFGRKLVSEAIKEIKKEHPGMVIKLAALPFDGGMDMVDLVAWYEDQGFSIESADGHAVTMTY